MTIRLLTSILAIAGSACASGTGRTLVPTQPRPAAALTISVSARVASAPAQVVVRTRVEPDARNRALSIEWSNADGAGGMHTISLDGVRAAVHHDCLIKNMASGDYVVHAVLIRQDARQVLRTTRLIVVGEGTGLPLDALGSANRR